MDSNIQSLQSYDQKATQIQNQKTKSVVLDTANVLAAVRDRLSFIIETDLSSDLANLIQLRSILEPGIAAIAAEMATEEDIEAMQEAIAALEGDLSDADRFVKADQSFHLVLARATQNSFVPILLNSIIELSQEHNAHYVPVNGGILREQAAHQRILEAIRQRNSEAARQTMIDHLQQLLRMAKH